MVSGGIQAVAHSPVVQQRQVKIGSGPVRRELQRTWHILADGESVTPLARPHAAAMVVLVLVVFGDESDGITN
jgi:hypothetical protein